MNRHITARANADLDSIIDRVAQDNPDAARRLNGKILQEIDRLARHPGMGHRRPDVQDERYLFRAVGNYVIAYRTEGERLIVVRVLHGARDFGKHFRP